MITVQQLVKDAFLGYQLQGEDVRPLIVVGASGVDLGLEVIDVQTYQPGSKVCQILGGNYPTNIVGHVRDIPTLLNRFPTQMLAIWADFGLPETLLQGYKPGIAYPNDDDADTPDDQQ